MVLRHFKGAQKDWHLRPFLQMIYYFSLCKLTSLASQFGQLKAAEDDATPAEWESSILQGYLQQHVPSTHFYTWVKMKRKQPGANLPVHQ